MDSNQNKLLVMQAYELYQRGDIKGVLALCSDDIEMTIPDNEHIPYSGQYYGQHGAGNFFTKLGAASDTLSFTPRHFIAEGDKVVVTGNARWHVKATGADFTSEWVHVFTVRDGKLARLEQHSDTAAAEKAFRMTPGSVQSGASLRH